MSVSAKVKAILSLSNKDIPGLASHIGIGQQSLRNKLSRDSFSASDLIKIADYCNASLCFLRDDGSKVVIDESDLKQEEKS